MCYDVIYNLERSSLQPMRLALFGFHHSYAQVAKHNEAEVLYSSTLNTTILSAGRTDRNGHLLLKGFPLIALCTEHFKSFSPTSRACVLVSSGNAKQ